MKRSGIEVALGLFTKLAFARVSEVSLEPFFSAYKHYRKTKRTLLLIVMSPCGLLVIDVFLIEDYF